MSDAIVCFRPTAHSPQPTASPAGFTLIETMVAIAVLAIALVGPFTAVQSALTASYIARDELIASSLAQEGMEYIRSIRDNNYLPPNNRPWMTGLSSVSCYAPSPAGPSSYCTVDPSLGDVNTNPSAVVAYSTLASSPVLKVTTSGLYNHQGLGTNTAFRRGVRITSLPSGREVRVSVTVSWTSAHQSYMVTVTDTLNDWL